MNTATNVETWRQECRGWARLFDFGARLYLHEPCAQLLEECLAVGSTLKAHFPDQAFPELLVKAGREEVATVRQEFFDLFFVPVSHSYCPPFAALRKKSARGLGVAGDNWPLFQETGFLPSLLSGLPSYLRCLNRADYIGFELAFMATLLDNAGRSNDRAKTTALLNTAATFHEKHLSGWAADLAENIDHKAASAYFRACAQLTMYMVHTFDLPPEL
jgi:TorA maturation chaperone TorD